MAVRPGQLEPDEQGFEPADDEEHERRGAVEDPDLLVVDRGEPAPHAGGRTRPTERRSRRGDGLDESRLGEGFALEDGHPGLPCSYLSVAREATRLAVSSSVTWRVGTLAA